MSLQQFAVSDVYPSLWSPCLVEEITRRVVDDYGQAVYMLALAAAGTADAEAQTTLASVAMRLRAQAEAHRALQAPANHGPMDLAAYTARVCGCLSRSLLAGAGMRLAIEADELWLDADRCWRVGLIVAELIRDAAGHGSCDGPGAIWVKITEAFGCISCSVSDDRPDRQCVPSHRGRALVEALAAELGGSVDWSFPPGGCVACLEFPRAADSASALIGSCDPSMPKWRKPSASWASG